MRQAFVKAGGGKACYLGAGMRREHVMGEGARWRRFSPCRPQSRPPIAGVRDKAGMIAPICAFSSAADCVHAALLGPSGSVCVQEGTPAAWYKDPADKTPKRPYRRDADRDYSYNR